MIAVIDLEAAMSRTLRADPDVTAIVADRVWLTQPRNPSFPAIRITRVAGAPDPTWQQTILYDDGEFDVWCYGGSRVEALTLAQTALRVLCASRALGIEPFNVLHLPDPDLPQEGGRDRERYIVSLRAFATTTEVTP